VAFTRVNQPPQRLSKRGLSRTYSKTVAVSFDTPTPHHPWTGKKTPPGMMGMPLITKVDFWKAQEVHDAR
jgi:hypothetical protein